MTHTLKPAIVNSRKSEYMEGNPGLARSSLLTILTFERDIWDLKMTPRMSNSLKHAAAPYCKITPKHLRAAACKNREPHFTDHLVEFLIFRLKITLDELFSKIIF